jgi:hypothetical protein
MYNTCEDITSGIDKIRKENMKTIELLFNITDIKITINIISHMRDLEICEDFIKFFDDKINYDNIQNIDDVFINCVKCIDIISIKKLLDYKYIPKASHLYHLNTCDDYYNDHKNKILELIQLFVNLSSLGVIINDEIYVYLSGIDVWDIESIDFPHVSKELKENIKNKIYYSKHDLRYQGGTIKNMVNLRKLFRNGFLSELIEYTETNNTLIPDELCFFNSLYNSEGVIEYVINKYKYRPSFFDILIIKNTDTRIWLIKKFYPNYLLTDHMTLANSFVNQTNIEIYSLNESYKQIDNFEVSFSSPISSPKNN